MSDEAAAQAAIEEARRLVGDGAYAEARAACDRARAALGAAASPLLRAIEVGVRASADPERAPDPGELEGAGTTLVAHGQWEEAAGVQAVLARAAAGRGDLPDARYRFALAIGCAEAAGARVTGPGMLRQLALAELAGGEPARAIGHLVQALVRLERVALLGARLAEAECMESLGDAHAALGDRAQAAACWQDAAERQERLYRSTAAARVRAKLAAPAS